MKTLVLRTPVWKQHTDPYTILGAKEKKLLKESYWTVKQSVGMHFLWNS